MFKKFIAAVITMIIIIALFWFLIANLVVGGFNTLQNETDTMTEMVGKNFILKDDTLQIIDYSLVNETYTLDNGVVVNRHLVENQKNKK